MKKTERLQMIIMCLKQKGKSSAKELSDYLEVSKRTIYRDIDALSQMNIPIIAHEGTSGGYEIDGSYFMPTIRLTEREVLILMLLLKFSKQLNLPDFNESINILDLKLRNACGDSSEKYTEILEYVSIDVQNIFPEPHPGGTFEIILDAFGQNLKLRITYYSPLKNKIEERNISPLRLSYSDGGWYLDAFCHSREKKRTFRLDRILNISILQDEVDPALYKQYRDEALNDEKLKIEFEISRDLYNLIKYDSAMIGAVILSEDTSNYRVLVETSWLVYFETLAVRNSEQVTILGPESFVERIKRKITNAMEKYC